jgi:hypothetical protein
MVNWRERLQWRWLQFEEGLRRLWCQVLGHNWRYDGGMRSAVIPLVAVCRRCGKLVRLIEPGPGE